MEMQAMEAEVPRDEPEIVESCKADETVHSDDSSNLEVIDESIIFDIVNEICDSAIQSFDCDIKTKELAQDIVRSMSEVSYSLLNDLI
jgi:hypothetical protein